MSPILKLAGHNEIKEIAFELQFLKSLSLRQRFQIMENKSREIRSLLKKNGHRKTAQITKRT